MSEFNLYQRALNHIENIEYEYGIHMDYEEFTNKSLPAYFNININDISDGHDHSFTGIVYTFEVYEGSAQMVCGYDKDKDEIFVLELNEVLSKHVENKWKIYEYKSKDNFLNVQ